MLAFSTMTAMSDIDLVLYTTSTWGFLGAEVIRYLASSVRDHPMVQSARLGVPSNGMYRSMSVGETIDSDMKPR